MSKLIYIVLLSTFLGSFCSCEGHSSDENPPDNQELDTKVSMKIEFFETYPLHWVSELIINADMALKKYVEINGDSLIPARNPNTSELLKQQEGTESIMAQMRKSNPLRIYLLGGFEPKKNNRTGKFINACRISNIHNSDTAAFNSILNLDIVKREFPKDLKFFYGITAFKELSKLDMSVVYAIKKQSPHTEKPFMDGSSIKNATAKKDANGNVTINVQLNKRGTKKWAEATLKNIGFQIAIVRNGYVFATITSQDSITDGLIEIPSSFSLKEAQEIANSINLTK